MLLFHPGCDEPLECHQSATPRNGRRAARPDSTAPAKKTAGSTNSWTRCTGSQQRRGLRGRHCPSRGPGGPDRERSDIDEGDGAPLVESHCRSMESPNGRQPRAEKAPTTPPPARASATHGGLVAGRSVKLLCETQLSLQRARNLPSTHLLPARPTPS